MKRIILSSILIAGLNAKSPLVYIQDRRRYAQQTLKTHNNDAFAAFSTLAFTDTERYQQSNLISAALTPLMMLSQVYWNLLIYPILLIPDDYSMVLPAAAQLAIITQTNLSLLIILALGFVINNSLHIA